MLNVEEIRKQFKILDRKINGKRLAYLDNASTTQKPHKVIQALTDYYENNNSNIHRGIHTLSEESTTLYESARVTLQKFLNAKLAHEIIFTRNTTEAINLVAYTFGEKNIHEGDEIIVSELEHHANLIPWQELCKRKKATLKVIPIKEDLNLDMEIYEKLLSEKTKLVAVTGMSNVTGTIPNIKKIIELAHKFNSKVLIDGAQLAAHTKIDLQELNCDFFTISGHKMLGPTGSGALYGKEELLNEMPPFLFGGGMVLHVTQQETSYTGLPDKFEAGTPNIAETIAFKSAIEYLEEIGMENIQKHEKELTDYAIELFSKHKEVKIFHPENGGGVVSFTIEGIHPHDIASIFNEYGVAIRSGKHCAHPLIERLKIPSLARMSFYIYNNKEDVEQAEKALKETIKIFK
ncbi:cysteine desulfurase [Candidatus Peregrinibacteria bacterium CG10_big_fil_rev_8_21_14_0_10_36_19]|nr:MAG: cysteine desulfurase [Candidatus Peregrinibacteria bacterium CG10_big_fil_rev_8_21_14_0_10_36_19]